MTCSRWRGTSRVRRLPVRLAPAGGEAFSSYVDRLASDLGVPLATLLSATGAFDRREGLPRGYGAVAAPENLDAFAVATGIDVRRVETMLVSSYGGIVFGGYEWGEDVASYMRFLARQWVYVSGSHGCPRCILKSGGVWKLAWKLPWSFACVRHRLLLVGVCPSCRRRTGTGRPDRRSAPNNLTAIPQPGSCANPLRPSAARTGRAARACGYLLAEASCADLDRHPQVLAAQQVLDAALDGQRSRVAGEPVWPAGYFGAMRSLCALILYAAHPEDVVVAGPLASAFEAHVARRGEVDEMRRRIIESGRDGRTAPRTRCYLRVPDDPALMAAIAPFAVQTLAAESPDAFAVAIAPLVARAEARNREYVKRLPDDFSFSAPLRRAFELGLAPSRRFVVRSAMQAQRGRVPRFGFGADHVPQLVWRAEFEESFVGLIPGTYELTARRFCSMALVKLAHACTWDEAAVAIGLTDCSGSTLACAVVARLGRAGTADRFSDRLSSLAALLHADDELIDYGARRRALQDFVDIAPYDWQLICSRAGVRLGKQGGRQRFAAAWLWCELTGGDCRLAPALRGGIAGSTQDSYRRFLARNLDDLKPELIRYGVEHFGLRPGVREDPADASGSPSVAA